MSRTHYINTDLDLVADFDISVLIAIFAESCDVLYFEAIDSTWSARIEASPPYADLDHDGFRSADRDLSKLLRVADGLSGAPLEQWNRCTKRDLNLGFDCGDTWAFGETIRHELLTVAARVGCSLSLTLYPPEDADRSRQDPESPAAPTGGP